MKENRYIYGPVPSRRLGHSLGVDVVPFKVCTFDCIYCQLGRTTNKTLEKEEFYPVADIIEELKEKLSAKDNYIDYITISGSGEPTLYSKLEELIERITSITNIPVAVLTNGSLLWDKEVQKALQKANLVIPSLDAGREDVFKRINRPCSGLCFKKVIEGIIEFSNIYENKIWLEIFLLNGINDTETEIKELDYYIKKIQPDKVQLNTAARPTAENFATLVRKEKLKYLKSFISSKAEIICDFKENLEQKSFSVSKNEIIALLNRRPCSLDDIANGLNLHRNESLKYIQDLLKKNKISKKKLNGKEFYYKN